MLPLSPQAPRRGGVAACSSDSSPPALPQVLLDDVPISRLDPGWFHRQVALVGQEPVLFARSIEDNICYGLGERGEGRPSTEEVHAAAQLANAHDFVSGFDLGCGTPEGTRSATFTTERREQASSSATPRPSASGARS